jgi:hypothetical protein
MIGVMPASSSLAAAASPTGPAPTTATGNMPFDLILISIGISGNFEFRK